MRGTPLGASVHNCVRFCMNIVFTVIADGNASLGTCFCNQKLCFLLVFECFRNECCENARNSDILLLWLKMALYNFISFFMTLAVKRVLCIRDGHACTYFSSNMYKIVFGAFLWVLPMKVRLHVNVYKVMIGCKMQQTCYT